MLLVIMIGLFAISAQGLTTPDSCQRVTYNFTLDKKVFHVTRWRNPSAQPTNIVFLSHGYGEYIDFTYHQLADVLCHQGSLVLSHDHVGLGRSRSGHQHNSFLLALAIKETCKNECFAQVHNNLGLRMKYFNPQMDRGQNRNSFHNGLPSEL